METDDSKKVSQVVDVEKAKLNYREWNLLSEPKFFQINSANVRSLKGDTINASLPSKTTEIIVPKAPVVEGFTDTITVKSGQTFKNVKTQNKENSVIITTQDGKSFEVNKTDLVPKK